MKIIYSLLLFSITLFATCLEPTTPKGNPTLPTDYQQYVLPDKPTEHEDMPKFEEKAELGKVLFFTKLNGTACSDCHSPQHGFTAGQQQSCGRGCEGILPNRIPIAGEDADTPPLKSPSSIGVFGSKNLLWTGLAGSSKDPLEGLFLPILGQGLLATDAHDMSLVADSIRAHHPSIFEQLKEVYTGVEDNRFSDPLFIVECMAAFQMQLIPNESQFQKWLKEETTMSEKAKQGLKAFNMKCANCHKPPFLGDDTFMDVGFPHLANDIHDGTHKVKDGRFLVTKEEADRGKFRTMRLATNVTTHITWGHGGTFKTLESCIAGHQHEEMDSISVDEIDDIIEFLYTTVDQELKDMVPQ